MKLRKSGKSKEYKHRKFEPLHEPAIQIWINQKQLGKVKDTPYATQPTKIGETKNNNNLQTQRHSQQISLEENYKM